MESCSELRRAVEDAKRRCEALEDSIQTLRIPTTWKTTLLRLLHSELSFLNRFSLSLSQNHNTHSSNSSLSVNIGHLESVVLILQQPFISGVSRVCKPIPLSFSETLAHKGAACVSSIYVDIVCCLNGKPVWFIVSDRKPKYISWCGSSTEKGLQTRTKCILDAAQSSEALRPSSIILFFSNGLDDTVRRKLQDEFGAADFGLAFSGLNCAFSDEYEDDWTNVLTRSYCQACVLKIDTTPSTNTISTPRIECEVRLTSHVVPEKHIDVSLDLGDSFSALISGLKCCSLDAEIGQLKTLSDDGSVKLVNFDTTALIAIVSEIINGGTANLLATPENELRSRFKGNYEFVVAQVNSEIENAIHRELAGSLAGKGGIMCESVYSEFQELISMCGGPKEKLRSYCLLKLLKVVPDSPSNRMMNLPTTRKLSLKNKVVFGTGDNWLAPTLTANMAFVRAVSQTGMSLFTIEHRPRALVGE